MSASLGKFIAEAFVRPIASVIIEELRRPQIFVNEGTDEYAENDLDALANLPVVGVPSAEGYNTPGHDSEPPFVRIVRNPGVRG